MVKKLRWSIDKPKWKDECKGWLRFSQILKDMKLFSAFFTIMHKPWRDPNEIPEGHKIALDISVLESLSSLPA